MILTANRYAQVLFNVCNEKGWLDIVYEDFKNVFNLLEIEEEFGEFLQSPMVSHKKRLEVLQSIFHNKIDEVTYRIIVFLEEKKHLHMLQSIIKLFIHIYLEEKNIIHIIIMSSTYLNNQQINAICHHLKLKTRKEIEAEQAIDPTLLGGFKIRIGDVIYDYSLKGQLNRFSKQLQALA